MKDKTETKNENASIIFKFSILVIVFCSIFINVAVPTSSMAPTIEPHDRFLTVRNYLTNFERKDVINFKYPDDGKTWYCKRIVGMPGETIVSVNGILGIKKAENIVEVIKEDYVKNKSNDSWEIYVPKEGDEVEVIDGEAYIENYCLGDAKTFLDFYCDQNGVVTEDCYFVLGDNRSNSLDARYWEHQFVKESTIVSKLIFCYFSNDFKHLGFLN